MKSFACVIGLALSISLTNNGLAQAGKSTDEQSISAIVQDLQDGWNAKSGEQFAQHFADDHDYVVWTGLYMANSTRTNNANAHQGLFNGPYKNMDIMVKVEKIRFIKPDVALVHTLSASTFDKSQAYPTMLQTIIMVKENGNWEIVSFHNLDIEYDKMFGNQTPDENMILGYARKNYQGWYR